MTKEMTKEHLEKIFGESEERRQKMCAKLESCTVCKCGDAETCKTLAFCEAIAEEEEKEKQESGAYISIDALYSAGYTHVKGHTCENGQCRAILTPLDEIAEVLEGIE